MQGRNDPPAGLPLLAEVPNVSVQPTMETLQTVIRREFQVVRERVGDLDLWVLISLPNIHSIRGDPR